MLDTDLKLCAIQSRPTCDLEVKIRDLEKKLLKVLVKVFRGKPQFREATLACNSSYCDCLTLTEAVLLNSDRLQSCQSKGITTTSQYGQILVQSGWSAVALVIIIYSRWLSGFIYLFFFLSTKTECVILN